MATTAPALYDSVADRFAPQYDITGLLTNVNREHAEADRARIQDAASGPDVEQKLTDLVNARRRTPGAP